MRDDLRVVLAARESSQASGRRSPGSARARAPSATSEKQLSTFVFIKSPTRLQQGLLPAQVALMPSKIEIVGALVQNTFDLWTILAVDESVEVLWSITS